MVAGAGIAAGLAGGALTLLLHAVQHAAFGYSEATFVVGVERASELRRVRVLLLAGVVAGLGWWVLRERFGPATGVTESVRYADGAMPLRRTVLDALLQVVVVGLGASLGREGAPRETAAALGCRFSNRCGLTPAQRRIVVACAAGAGLAAVYNVPVGGAVFTLEVLLGSLNATLVVATLVSSALATAVAWTMLPNEATYRIPLQHNDFHSAIAAVPIGVAAGLAAVAFVRLVVFARGPKPVRGWLLVSTTVVFVALGALAVPYPQLLGNGKGPAQVAFDAGATPALLTALVLLKPLATVACLRSGAAGGLFTPVLSTGALLGGLVGSGWSDLFSDPSGAYAVMGAAAVLAAATRAPVSAVVLIWELTHVRLAILAPVVATVVIACVVARAFEDRSIYTVGLRHPVREAA